MTAYRRILAAIDLTQDSRAVAGRACDIARADNGIVQLLHVLEIVPIEPMSDSLVPVMQTDQQMMLRTREQIAALALAARAMSQARPATARLSSVRSMAARMRR